MSHPLFAQIEREMPGYLSAAIGSLDNSSAMSVHAAGGLSLDEAAAPLVAMVKAYTDTYEALGGRIDMGSNDEVLISASKGYLLIKVDHRSRRFIAVLLSSNGNIGFLRFQLRTWIRKLSA